VLVLSDDRKQLANGTVVGCETAFEFSQLGSEFFMAGQHLPQANESPDDRHADGDCAFRAEDACEHGDALLSKNPRRLANATAAGF
jgi:hypothetical protein